MRFSYILLVVFIGIFSCSRKKDSNYFIIEGQLDQGQGGKIIVSRMTRDGFQNIDSSEMNQKGAFSLKGKISKPGLYALWQKSHDEYITLGLHPGEIIKVNLENFDFPLNYTIEGSEDSKLIKEMNDSLFSLLDKKITTDKLYQEEKDSLDGILLEQARKTRNEKIDSLNEAHKSFIKKMIRNNDKSLAILVSLYQQVSRNKSLFDPEKDYDIYVFVDSVMMKNYPGLDPVKMLHEEVIKIKNKPIRIGMIAPEIKLPNTEGKDIPLSSLRGNYVLLDFWASWCLPCRHQNPLLVKLYNLYHDQGFEIYQVSLDKKEDAWLKGIREDKIGSWIQVSDLKFWNSSVVNNYNIKQIPTNFLLDPSGKIIEKDLHGRILEEKLSKIFK